MNGWTKDGSSVREYFERSQFGVIIYKPLTWYLLDLVDNNGHMVRHEHAIWFTGQGIREAAIPFTPESLIERWDTGDRRVVNGLAKINRNKAAGKILLAI